MMHSGVRRRKKDKIASVEEEEVEKRKNATPE